MGKKIANTYSNVNIKCECARERETSCRGTSFANADNKKKDTFIERLTCLQLVSIDDDLRQSLIH